MAQIKEGFLCPICMTDLGDVIQLQLHFDERHSKEDPAFVQNLKDLFVKAKQKIKKGIDDGSVLLGNDSTSDISSIALADNFSLLNESLHKVNIYGTEYSSKVHPVSGIHNAYLEQTEIENRIPTTDHMDYYRVERAKRADMLAMDSNKLIIRLEKLLKSLPHDPVKRRAHEQAVVSWLPEEVVKLCPNCARSFNLTRRKHHCRLCGSIMCSDCSDNVQFDMAKRLINPDTISKYETVDKESESNKSMDTAKNTKRSGLSLEKSRLNPSYDNLAKNLADLTGLAEAQKQFRTCTYCAENLRKRDSRVTLSTESVSPILQRYYEKLRQLMMEGEEMSNKYREVAAMLNAGEPATKLKLEEAKHLRIRLLKAAENVEAVSKAIITLDEDDTTKTLRSRIRTASINFVKETLVGLPGIPTEDELQKLQVERKNEAARKIQEEQKAAATAKLKYEQDIVKRSSKLSASPFGVAANNRISPQALPKVKRGKERTVRYGNGFVSSTSRAKTIDTDDPIVLQMGNLRDFIIQAKEAGKMDDAKLLEENLRDLQEEYQRQRQTLEENYNTYKNVFGKKASGLDSVTPDDVSSNSPTDENSFDENNPFFVGPEDEMHEIEQVLRSDEKFNTQTENDMPVTFDDTNPFNETQNEEKVTDGSIDFDEYDRSGRNPFF